MLQSVTRRDVLRAAVAAAGACVLPRFAFAQQKSAPLFQISLAQWSLNKAFFGKAGATKRDPMDFAKISKEEFGIDAIEYVN
ncbi:MAG TPA: sugar phosphate isomerase/epimerase, partial [Planctomycetaceae bacterium]|nr:sugar phosphate isomerase/epimerase [Planctomycetaceae bacterium]